MSRVILADADICRKVALCCENEDFADFAEGQEFADEHVFSDTLRQRMLALAESLDRPRRIPRRVKLIIILAALIALIAAAAVGVSGLRDAEYRMQVIKHRGYMDVWFTLDELTDDALPAPDHIAIVFDLPVPAGYEQTYRSTGYVSNIQVFESFELNEYGKRKTVNFEQNMAAARFSMDADDVELFAKTVNGVKYYCHDAGDWAQIDWVQYGYIFIIIAGDMSIDELISFAERIDVNEELTELVSNPNLHYNEKDGQITITDWSDEAIEVIPNIEKNE